MYYKVKLPDLGDDAPQEATIVFWTVEEGETIKKGDDLLEITTDKAAFNVPSPRSGVLIEKLVPEGSEVSTGEVICILDL